MSDYDLHYWPIPFRGQLIRWVMAYAGATWAEHDAQEVIALYKDDPDSQPLPFMAPPLLHDAEADVWMSQLTAVLSHLGDAHGLMPISPADRAATVKLICDANDVLNDITRGGGEKLWTQAAWDDTGLPRLTRWMAIFEQGAEAQTSVLGRDALGLADLVNAALWHTMTTRMHMLRPVLDTHALCGGRSGPELCCAGRPCASSQRTAPPRRGG